MSRSYGEGCLAAHALDLIGDRWALLVVRELMLGPKRFGAIRAGVPGIATNILAQRLEQLARAGLLAQESLPPPAMVTVYRLTAPGLALWPVIRALCVWGAGQAGHDPARFISTTSLMLSMRALARGAPGLEVTADFRLGDEAFQGRLSAQGFDPQPGGGAGQIAFEGPTNSVAAAVYGPVPLAEMMALGRIGFRGDAALGQRFVDCFALAPVA